jgi:hypothetical protein
MARNIIFVVSLVVIVACEQVIDIEMPTHVPKLVVNSINGTDSLFYFNITQSRGITEPVEQFKPVLNATIKIYEDGSLLEEITETTLANDFGGYYKSSLAKSVAGKNYKIEVSAPGFNQVASFDQVPSKIIIESVELDTKNKVERDHSTYYPLYITFSDPPAVRNYYMAHGFVTIRYSFGEGNHMQEDHFWVQLESDDPLIQNENPNDFYYHSDLLFTDFGFDGKQETRLKLLADVGYLDYIFKNNQVHFAEFQLSLLNTTEAFYRYVRSKNLQEGAKGNPFAEPVQVYNNITNGYGIFGLYAKNVFAKEIDADK